MKPQQSDIVQETSKFIRSYRFVPMIPFHSNSNQICILRMTQDDQTCPDSVQFYQMSFDRSQKVIDSDPTLTKNIRKIMSLHSGWSERNPITVTLHMAVSGLSLFVFLIVRTWVALSDVVLITWLSRNGLDMVPFVKIWMQSCLNQQKSHWHISPDHACSKGQRQ